MLTSMNPPNVIEAGDFGNLVLFNWDIIDKCQFQCTYCYATDFNKNEFFEKNLHRSTWKLILNRLSRLDFDFVIEIRGGEPTLHPNFHEIISALESFEHCKCISIYTNLAEKMKVYTQLDVPNSKVELHMSFHVEYAKHYLRKVLVLNSMVEHMVMFSEVVLYPKEQYYQQYLDLISDLEDNDITFGVVIVRENKFWDSVYEQNFFETFDRWINDANTNKFSYKIKHTTADGDIFVDESYMLKNKFHYKGFKCQQLSYNIAMNGDIVNLCNNVRVPLNAKEADFKKVITCPNSVPCYCYPMLLYKKVHPLHYVKPAESN